MALPECGELQPPQPMAGMPMKNSRAFVQAVSELDGLRIEQVSPNQVLGHTKNPDGDVDDHHDDDDDFWHKILVQDSVACVTDVIRVRGD